MNLIGLKDLSRHQMIALLDASERYLNDEGRVITPPEDAQLLSGRTFALLFLEPSTRTRASFDLAIQRLGGQSVTVNGEGSSVEKGESAADTCQTLAAMGVDGLVVRHHDRHLPQVLAERVRIPVINAGNGSGEHPTQGLLDALTLRRHFKTGNQLGGLKIAIIGDIVHSRVARSDAHIFSELGAEVMIAGPKMLIPTEERLAEWPVRVSTSLKEAVRWADAVVVLRVQQERLRSSVVDPHRYALDWGIDPTVVEQYMSPSTMILHPGPVIRGVELADPVIESPQSLIWQQVTHGVAVRQAVIAAYFGRQAQYA
ncbi:aspartate carbamoyltransferase catalytic subunit [Lujinxingia vulgaris]|uniref:Aspartate carbamoyltransferase n=1 Tax=Lujinxingia vulgaris TaxID=2600176 RepID=A0A5C6X900_9DELT|nr:aspartate carbamoyltransferase catalytic subunit [Lujinxingia vulgaris]TXD37838.1 aspartate carbamoyltransferase catalytic subunit [Lujinxingia vulgaris]